MKWDIFASESSILPYEVLDEDTSPDSDEDESGDDLRPGSDMMSPSLAELESDICGDQCHDSDHESRQVDICGSRRERYTDCECVDARRDPQCHEWSQWEYILRYLSLIRSSPSCVHHIASDIAEEGERDPVAISHDLLRKKRREQESDNRHHRLEKSKRKSHRKGLFGLDTRSWDTSSHRHSECIGRYWESKEEYSN